MRNEITIPFASATMEEGTISEWLRQEGDWVAEAEVICHCETDKATIEIPSPVAGLLHIAGHETGVALPVGTVIAHVEPDSG